MDKQLRDLERRIRQGDLGQALFYERHRRRIEGPRERLPALRYQVSIDTRRVSGELELTVRSNQEISFDNWKVPLDGGGQGDIPLLVNDIPHSIQFTYHNFDEYGWQPTSLKRLLESQQEREALGRNWNFHAYLAGRYREGPAGLPGATPDAARPNIYLRRTDRPFNRGEPTPRARARILELGREIAETWPQDHPEEMYLAQKAYLNNEIMAITETAEELYGRMEELNSQLASLVIQDMD